MIKWLRSLLADAAKSAILSLLATVTPPVAIVLTRGRAFMSTPSLVPGWALLVGAGAAGLLLFSIGLNVVQSIRFRRAGQQTLMIVAEGDPRGLWWHMGAMGDAPAMQVFGGFHITNRSPYNVTIPRSVLLVSYRQWRVIPRQRRVESDGLFNTVLQAHHLVREQLHWWVVPPVLKSGQVLRAKVGVLDNFGRTNWGEWREWRYQ